MKKTGNVLLYAAALSQTTRKVIGLIEIRFKVSLKIPVRCSIPFPTNQC